MKRVTSLVLVVFVLLSILPVVSAGVGISWDRETALIPEKSNVCLTYGVYNPWPTDSYVKIELSEELQPIIKSTDVKVNSIPKYTYSNSSIPVEFCFRTPVVYKEDCLLGPFLCKQECNESMKIYDGEVNVLEVSESEFKGTGGSGGSATSMSVSAPLKIKVKCLEHSTDYSIIYIIVGIIALLIFLWRFLKRKKKGKKSKKGK